MLSILQSNYSKRELLLVIIGVLLSIFLFKTTMIHTDNTQLMDKVVKIHQTGEWTHHGNAATKMGSLPGSFLTFITAVPMLLWFSPYAACVVILLFHLFSYVILRKLAFKLIENFNPIYLAVFYWLNPWRVEQSELYNPSYLFLFGAAYLYTVYKMSEHKSFWWSMLLVVNLGLCMQVHFSVLILGISFGYLFLRRIVKVNYMGIAAGLILVVLSLVPWFLSMQHGVSPEIKSDSSTFIGRNFILVYPVIKALIYFFRMGSLYFGRHIFSEIGFDWLTTSMYLKNIVAFLFHSLKWILAGTTVFLSFRYFVIWFKKIKTSSNNDFLDHLLVSIVLGVFISASLSPVEFNHWHFVICFPLVVFLILAKLQLYFCVENEGKLCHILKVSTVVFCIWGILIGLQSRTHNIANDYERDFRLHYKLEAKEQ